VGQHVAVARLDGIVVRVGNPGSTGPMAAAGGGQIHTSLGRCWCLHQIHVVSSAWGPMSRHLSLVVEGEPGALGGETEEQAWCGTRRGGEPTALE
jgi:hypothetical protein